MKTFGIITALSILLLVTANVYAQNEDSQALESSAAKNNLEWEHLSESDRAALIAPIRERWKRSSPERRSQMLDRAKRWQAMSPEQRQLARDGARRYHRADSENKKRMREVFQHIKQLPPAEREKIIALWRQLTPEQRREWMQRGGPGKSEAPKIDNTQPHANRR